MFLPRYSHIRHLLKCTKITSTAFTDHRLPTFSHHLNTFATKAAKINPNLVGIKLYEQVADRVNYAELFLKFNMPNTYNSWFLITELHVWMVLVRVMAMQEHGRALRNAMVESMWVDATTRAKQLLASNPSSVKEHLNVLSQQFQAALITYDDGLNHDDKCLATSLWLRFFEKKCNYDDLNSLVEYVRKHIQVLENIPDDQLTTKPDVKWSL